MSAKMEISSNECCKHCRHSRRRVRGISRGRRRHHHRRNDDFAVEGIQEAGRELSRTFRRLEKRCKAKKLVRAIRCRDAREINRLLDRDCRVLHFFCKPEFDCVKIGCGFGRRDAAIITFDICVRSRFEHEHRRDCCF